MKGALVAAASIFILITAGASAHAMDNWRCGNLLLDEGTHSFLVERDCGRPYLKKRVGCTGGCFEDDSHFIIEKWVYGPYSGYFYILYFIGGELDRLESVRAD
ncbi:MAG: DUF2845 domain-containing protein [Desulfobacterales bacterium]